MNDNLQIPEDLLEATMESEGFNPVAIHQPFDPPGVYTFGYGDTDCVPGQIITKPAAKERLRRRMMGFAKEVLKQVTVELTPGELKAIIDLAYNLGAHGFPQLLQDLNKGDLDATEKDFGHYVYSQHKILKGLVTRRQMEEKWFEEGLSVKQPAMRG